MAKIICVGGGKGGTGKSSVAVNMSVLLVEKGFRVLLVDADVESPVDHLLLGITRKKVGEVRSFLPRIDPEKCIRCGACTNACPEHALIGLRGQVPTLLRELCEGCKLCYYVCPVKAIRDDHRVIGEIYEGSDGLIHLIQGEVLPGVKQHVNVTVATIRYGEGLFEKYDYVIIDTAPGTGANIWFPLIKSDLAIAVTEPTPLGANDLHRYLELVKKAQKRFIVVLNKANIPGGRKELVKKVVKRYEGDDIIEIPYDKEFLESYIKSKLIASLSLNSGVTKALRELIRKALTMLES
ncbi:MAG: P-loop NTPase [Candidatus Njordarchaeales archaeon]